MKNIGMSKDFDKEPIREPIISRRLSDKFDIPEDIIAKAPVILGYGNHRLCIENYRSIIEYTGENLSRCRQKQQKIYIRGNKLLIAYFRRR